VFFEDALVHDDLQAGSADPGCDLLLVNTICFHGNWTVPFPPGLTAPGRFTRRDGSQVDCQMMHRTGFMRYAETAQYQAAWLSYGRDRFGMVLLLPAPGVALEALAADLDAARFRTLVQSLEGAGVDLAMPRFGCSTSAELKEPLTALGMGPAFDPALADFSRMATLPQVLLAVVHKARIAVDEQGTLAAAGTGVVAGATSVPGLPRTMVLDRPFLLAITDQETGTVLFLGEMGDPAAS
jgi:serpin B